MRVHLFVEKEDLTALDYAIRNEAEHNIELCSDATGLQNPINISITLEELEILQSNHVE